MLQWFFSADSGGGLLIVPRTPDGFRATAIALQTLDESKGVSFHTFFLPEDCCVSSSRIWGDKCLRMSGRNGRLWLLVSKMSFSSAAGTVTRMLPKPAS